MAETTDDDKPLNKAIAIFWVILVLFAVLVFISLPLSAGIGSSILIFGMEQVRQDIAGWFVYWAMGTLIATAIVAGIIEAVLKSKLPGNKPLREAASWSTGFVVMTVCYSGFFYSWVACVVASAVSALLFILLLWIVKKFPAPRRPTSQAD
ncbi:hypothetical protein CQ017_09330 [Arthrobacter sp. MYb224]|uniref:hypothetical protein n=1 Tax=Arthrobacter sp. MYb224 TaxID=1848600 RepID=UPI000CFD1E94|nr:hypothetical protein [Arthrobacter sp. MYb224]PQZ98736.1 hypothetical protein CQ017_09330 [Arthrobacter sp. MYb224]